MLKLFGVFTAPSMVRKHSRFLPLIGMFICLVVHGSVTVYVCLFYPHPLTVTQALKFMMDLEDDSDWSLSDEVEEEDSNRYIT